MRNKAQEQPYKHQGSEEGGGAVRERLAGLMEANGQPTDPDVHRSAQ